jgi:hypothetical protein
VTDERPPCTRFDDVPEETREWISTLRKDDIDDLNEAVRFFRSAKIVGTFTKWTLITIFGAFIGAVAFGEAVVKLWSWALRKG